MTIEESIYVLALFIFGAETFYIGYSLAKDWFKKKEEEKENKKDGAH